MAGRNRIPPHLLSGPRGLPPGAMHSAGGGPFGGHPMPPQMIAAGPVLAEEKIMTQHAEIQRLLSENQRLAATHVALRQELAAVQQEIQRTRQVIGGIQNERDQKIRMLGEKAAKIEADLRATEPMKVELHQLRTEIQNFHLVRQELMSQAQQLTQELQRARADVQAVPAVKSEIDALRNELERARGATEYEKKSSEELIEQRQAMEKNLISMAREMEKIRAQLTNVEKRGRLAGGLYEGYTSYAAGDPSRQTLYGDGYGTHQVPVGVENVPSYGVGTGTAWGAYDVPRGGGAHVRR